MSTGRTGQTRRSKGRELSSSILANNRPLGSGYNLAANTTNEGLYSYVYNAENQQTSAAGVNYTYDGDGKRVKKSNEAFHWYRAGRGSQRRRLNHEAHF